jgi:hypothetical protein
LKIFTIVCRREIGRYNAGIENQIELPTEPEMGAIRLTGTKCIPG